MNDITRRHAIKTAGTLLLAGSISPLGMGLGQDAATRTGNRAAKAIHAA